MTKPRIDSPQPAAEVLRADCYHRQVAAAILDRARMDWRRFGWVQAYPRCQPNTSDDMGRMMSIRCDYPSPRAELLAFFQSAWFEELALWLDIEPDAIRKKLRIPK